MELGGNFKIIDGFPNYSVSIDGTVVNMLSGRIKKHSYRTGYPFVSLYRDNKLKNFSVHRLIAINFIPNPDNKPFINHKNGIRDDNRIENLEWCTHQENMQHAYDTGLHKPHHKKINLGESGGQCKITEVAARDILSNTSLTQYELARKYGISQTQVSRIKNRIRWGHLL